MIKHEDLKRFKGQYPYGSELFGTYQTLIGWRGELAKGYMEAAFARERRDLSDSIFRKLNPDIKTELNADQILQRIENIGVGRANDRARYFSKLVESISHRIEDGDDTDNPRFWRERLSDERLLATLETEVREEAEKILRGDSQSRRMLERELSGPFERSRGAIDFLNYESRAAGYLKILRDQGATAELKRLFFSDSAAQDKLNASAALLAFESLIPWLGVANELADAVLSPIGIIHLFRQYFFELDSFLGPPVGHVWVAPHTTVELIEINRRRVLTESMIDEFAFARVEQSGESLSLDNLHEAVSRSNQQDLSFGASVSGRHSWIVGSVEATSSLGYHQTQSEARTTVHDLMRRQTQRIASVMEESLRTTFKTVTETEETDSKRYVVSNPENEVINYELRRKMRRVAVQVQDVGTYLSWQTFVDEPGRGLGIANLIHIAEPPNLASIPHPQRIEQKPQKVTTEVVMIPFVPQDHPLVEVDAADEGDKDDEEWESGIETSIEAADAVEGIQWKFPQKVRAPDKDYKLAAVKATAQGDAKVETLLNGEGFTDLGNGYWEFMLYLVRAHFHGADSIPVQLELVWESTEDLAKIQTENEKRMDKFVAEQKRAYEEAYVKAAQERIKIASKFTPRRYEDLRMEERIAVYRRLLRSLAPSSGKANMSKSKRKKFSYAGMSDQLRHIWSELLNSMFDLEKMLYFVAPDWWKPRANASQTMGAETAVRNSVGDIVKAEASTAIPERSKVSWGGGAEAGRPNYYITEDADPARFGSSLGWLLQLDGDSMRNAFLNAPWVKAIIPIRPGKEKEAIKWLKGVMEGDDGLTEELENQLNELAEKIASKHKEAVVVEDYPDPLQPGEDDATVNSTPVDRVFEFGFDPLPGGFRAQSLEGNEFEIIDQWIEVVPTDQIAAVVVKYDPATGRQLPTT